MIWTKIGWNWPYGYGEEDFKIHQYIFANHLPLEKGVDVHLKKTCNRSPSRKDTLCRVEIGQVILKKKKKKMRKVYSYNDDDNNGERTNFDQKSSLDPLAQVR